MTDDVRAMNSAQAREQYRPEGCDCVKEPWEPGSLDEYLACPHHNPASEPEWPDD